MSQYSSLNPGRTPVYVEGRRKNIPSDPNLLLNVMCWCGAEMVKVPARLVKMCVTAECGDQCYMDPDLIGPKF